jgi:hypothetical protein
LSPLVQELKHCVVSWHLYGAQFPPPFPRQPPDPLHVDGLLKSPVETLQVPAPHTVPDGQSRQLPLPSHLPSRPHVVAISALQLRAPTGIAPTATLEQMPSNPGTLHAWQVLLQVVSQQ